MYSQMAFISLFMSFTSRLGVCGDFFIRPKLNVAVLAQAASLDQSSLFAHQILNCHLSVAKDVEVVADYVPVAAAGAGNEDGPRVVPLLGDVVVRAVAAGDACEGELVVGRVLGLGPLAFCQWCVLGLPRGSGFAGCGCGWCWPCLDVL